ncbi:deoxycytidylate deaminase [Streptomyces sp. NBC_01751]|uniref:deoxycytidylate deaminase n=1 Tax=Streptomyces sp. NBC_01751 TaxID=2975929 RepID=UPI002DD93B2E|nr:deaminase [Streptomyces sp. NBC_01751]WSD23363.1 deaminase [Streptomyces sp. NBC_01751]
MTERPTWDEYFIGMAQAARTRADCTRAQVGAVVVHPIGGIPMLIRAGYNGPPPGVPGCESAGACPRGRLSVAECARDSDYSNCIADHAERNALRWTPVDQRAGSTLYVTRAPCPSCRTLIAANGLQRVVWPSGEWLPPPLS